MSQVFCSSNFQNGWYWIAGGTSGIGFAVAKLLAQFKAKLVVSGRSAERLAQAREQLLNCGAANVVTVQLDFLPATQNLDTNNKNNSHFERLKQITATTCDLLPNNNCTPAALEGDSPIKADNCLFRESVAANAKHSKAQLPLAGILLNGGGPHGANIASLTEADIEQAHWLLVKGPLALLQGAMPYIQRKTGSVVAITSTTVKESNPNLPLSGAYRSALVSLLKTAALTYGQETGIRINNVAPGYTATEKLEELKDYVALSNNLTHQQVTEQWASLCPLQRIASPEEIANTVLFLFSRASSFLTGQTLVVDGGQLKCY